MRLSQSITRRNTYWRFDNPGTPATIKNCFDGTSLPCVLSACPKPMPLHPAGLAAYIG